MFVQDETIGVLEFYSQKTLPDDPDLVKIMGAIGSQVGQVLKRTEVSELVRVSEARKSAMLETALDCIISMDHEGKIIEFNPAAETTFGYCRSDVVGKEMAEVIIPPAFREAHRRGLKHYLVPGESSVMGMRIEVIGMRSDHSEFPVELAITRIPIIDPPLFTGFLRDITERKRIENNSAFLMDATATLSSSLNYEETLSSVANLAVKSLTDWCSIDVMEDGAAPPRSVAVAHLDPSKIAVVDRMRQQYPPDWNALTGAPNVIRTGKSELYPYIPDELLETAATNQEHLQLMHDLGMKLAMVVPLKARTKILGVITFVSAESARRYTKDDLLLAEELARRAAIAIDNARLYRDAQDAIRVRDQFFSIASHELRTPISALKMSLQVSQMSVKPRKGKTVVSPEALNKMFDIPNRQVDRLTRLIDDLLDVVKIRARKLNINLEELNLSELVKDVAEQFSDALAAAKCHLDLNLEPTVVGVWDPTRVEQIVVNLISNAIKYAPGKPIKIEVGSKGETANLIVQDFGPGIPLEQQAKIFERFERAIASRNITGLGLGLFIVKQIVEVHCGTIRVDSQEGRGSTFTVELPTKSLDATLQNWGGGVSWKQLQSLSSHSGI